MADSVGEAEARETENSVSSSSGKKQKPLPKIFDGKYFVVTNSCGEDKIIAKCMHCTIQISGLRTSTGNFLRHYKVSISKE